MTWKAIARSAIGTSHIKQQMPCQDYGDYKIINDVIIGVVADGAGSAKYSDVGAKLAVDTVLKNFTAKSITTIAELYGSHSVEETQRTNSVWKPWNLLGKSDKNSNSITIARSPAEIKASQFFSQIVKQVVSALATEAKNNNYAIDDLACTLLILVATSDGITAMQIGDGFITVRYPEREPQLLFAPDKGEYINETTFVTSSNALKDMKVVIQAGQPKFVCASTDGLERLAIRMSDWTPFTPFFQPLEQYLQETENLEESDEYLLSFLNSERLNARTDDDKTLFLCLYDSSSDSPE